MLKVFGNRYEIGEMIGTGGMADVYIGEDQRLSRKVAVKVLRSDLARDPSFVARFRKEALAAAGLNHPGIVAVYDSGEEGANSYIVMELVNGHTLREEIAKSTPLTVDRSLEIIEGVLTALSYSHSNGIIHRDIKPGNIMLTDSGDVKVMDFGIARAMDDIGATMTSTWNVVGTAQYLSPEQATGTQADARSDLYSVGCLFYELVSGKPPFSGDTPVAIAYQHVSAQLTPVPEIEPSLDPALNNFFSVALAKEPSDRYQSANAMLKDLKKLSKGEGITTQIPRQKKPINRRNRIAALALALVLLVGGGSYVVFSPTSTTMQTLPNVVGLTEAEARAQLEGFTITIQRAPDPRIPRDRVASQIPLATTQVKVGSAITLTISDGPGDAIVPDNLVGMSLIDARSALTSVGLLVSQTIASPSDQPQGTVLDVMPAVGSVTEAGSSVILTIASGEVTVPNLIGIEAIQAKTLLIQAGFLIKEFYDYDSAQPAGVVIRQAPEAATTQTIGKSVTITINRQP